ncbi:hypothetical protein YPPY11_4336, partial [Yersinia pestis PY-11]
MINALFDE